MSTGTGLWRFVQQRDDAWQRERLLIVLLDPARKVIGAHELPSVRLNAVELRSACKSIPTAHAAEMVAVYSQPPADLSFKEETLRLLLKELAQRLQLRLLDCIVFQGGRCYSITDRRTQPPARRAGSARHARSGAEKKSKDEQ